MRQIWIPRPGPPGVLELREARDPLPERGQLRIRVEAAGVNFADVMGRMGIYPDLPAMPCVPGYEVAGQVDAVGEEVGTDWIGREVVALTRFGGYSDVVCVEEVKAFTLSEGTSAEKAACLPVDYLTAYLLIEVMGSLHEGETVLVHSAGGGVGIAATQLARRIGAHVIGTASEGEHGFLESIGVEHTIDSRKEDFVQRVAEITYDLGVELVLDAEGGSSFRRSFRCLSPTGRLGTFGFSTGAPGRRRSRLLRGLTMPWFRFSPRALMNANKGVFGVNLGHLWDESSRVALWMETLLDYAHQGAIDPVISASFSFDQAAEAHEFIQDRRNTGKVLLLP